MKLAKKNILPSVGQKIRTVRKSLGLTLDELGQQIGITLQALSAIERGSASPSRQTLINLARVLENDFGESWLKRYSIGTSKLTHSQVISKAIDEHKSVNTGRTNPILEHILDWSLEAQEAANLPNPVHLLSQKSAIMPIHYEIVNGATITKSENDDKVVIPFSMIPSIERARCARVQGTPIRDAVLGVGDILVLTEREFPEEGKIVLATIDNKLLIRRWELRGRKAIFTAHDRDYEPITVARKGVSFIGELLGVIRFISIVPVPSFFR